MKLFKNKKSRIWAITSLSAMTLLGVISGVTLGNKDIRGLLDMVMPGGGPRAIYKDGIEANYKSKYSSKKEVYKAAREMNQEICENGMVLLKNENQALPIATPNSDSSITVKPKVSVFGKNSVNIAYGGSGSGGSNDSNAVDLYQGLEAAGFEINPTLKDFYKDNSKSGPTRTGNSKNLDSGDTVILSTAETPQAKYTSDVKSSYQQYSDAAFIVITRIGGEGFDMPRKMDGANGYRNVDDHFLQLDQNEEDLIVNVCEAGFKKVVLLINSGTSIELGFLKKDNPYVTSKGYRIDPDKIDAAIWMGFPGETGTLGLGRILNGEVNPSGKLADTYVTDFKKTPSFENFGDNRITGSKSVPGGDQYVFDTPSQPSIPYYFVSYEEGIYVGYKYYETRGKDDESWYQDNVVYPFGYGLSYTNFKWEILDTSSILDKAIVKGEKYIVKVKVTNEGNVAGKDVVQLYGHAPYQSGEVEKPEENFLDFAKTKLLKPGESEDLELEFDPYYLASYDYQDKNHNGNKGYELDKGDDYALYISSDAHKKFSTVSFKVSEDILYKKDQVTNYDVINRYSDNAERKFDSDIGLGSILSRNDWENTYPKSPTTEDRVGSADLLKWLNDKSVNNPNDYEEEDFPTTEEDNGMILRDLLYDENHNFIDKDHDGIAEVDYFDERWESLLNQASIADMINVYDYASYQIQATPSVGLPRINCADGPVGWACFMDKNRFYDTCSYCCQTLVATTYDKDLAERFGEMVGDEGLIGDEKGGTPYSGWYAPGVNIHRSQFGGRNFEYYSEDGVLSGKMAASQIKGCNSRGVFTFVKHFAANEQETHRSISGDVTWVNEQALREIYLRPFELAVKEGKSRAIMSSFNRIGTRWTGGDYRLLTEILRNEWGFKGVVLCDFNTIPTYMNSRQMAYAGGDLNLATQPVTWCDESSTSDVVILRQCFKNALYTVVNSNAMNGEVVGYKLAYWVIGLIVVDVIAVVALGVWGFFSLRPLFRDDKQEDKK